MNKHALRTSCSLILSWSVALSCGQAWAQTLVAPEQLIQFGSVYKLAYKKSLPNGRAIYEYTTQGESVENWTSLVTLNYSKNLDSDPIKWSLASKASLDANNPKPHYKFYVVGSNGYANIIFEPDRSNPTYESNVQKSFHMRDCGLVVLQHAKKYPKSEDASDAGKLAALKSISAENQNGSKELEQSDWKPECS